MARQYGRLWTAMTGLEPSDTLDYGTVARMALRHLQDQGYAGDLPICRKLINAIVESI
jgi:hypothetical protein